MMTMMMMMMMMIMSPFGQLGLWAPSSGVDPRRIHINRVYMFSQTLVNEESGHPLE
jgi:hypothetical protein